LELQKEIDDWEKRLKDAAEEHRRILEQNKSGIEELQQAVEQKKRDLAEEKSKTEQVSGQARSEASRLSEVVGRFDKQADQLREKGAKARAYVETGIGAFSAGRDNEALVCFNQAVSMDPGLAVAYQMRGLAYERMGNLKAACDSYEQALELDPRNEALSKRLKDLRKNAGGEPGRKKN
jgi:tetratricopeptide (TPR) repeat protein